MKHPWFNDVNWEDVKALKVEPPIKPEVKDKFDTENFSKDVQKEGELMSHFARRVQGNRPDHHQQLPGSVR